MAISTEKFIRAALVACSTFAAAGCVSTPPSAYRLRVATPVVTNIPEGTFVSVRGAQGDSLNVLYRKDGQGKIACHFFPNGDVETTSETGDLKSFFRYNQTVPNAGALMIDSSTQWIHSSIDTWRKVSSIVQDKRTGEKLVEENGPFARSVLNMTNIMQRSCAMSPMQ